MQGVLIINEGKINSFDSVYREYRVLQSHRLVGEKTSKNVLCGKGRYIWNC